MVPKFRFSAIPVVCWVCWLWFLWFVSCISPCSNCSAIIKCRRFAPDPEFIRFTAACVGLATACAIVIPDWLGSKPCEIWTIDPFPPKNAPAPPFPPDESESENCSVPLLLFESRFLFFFFFEFGIKPRSSCPNLTKICGSGTLEINVRLSFSRWFIAYESMIMKVEAMTPAIDIHTTSATDSFSSDSWSKVTTICVGLAIRCSLSSGKMIVPVS